MIERIQGIDRITTYDRSDTHSDVPAVEMAA
jgi:hypothetical protein